MSKRSRPWTRQQRRAIRRRTARAQMSVSVKKAVRIVYADLERTMFDNPMFRAVAAWADAQEALSVSR